MALHVAFLLFAALPVLVVSITGDRNKIVTTLCGVAAAGASYAVETLLIGGLTASGIRISIGLEAFVVIALPEEGLKYLALAVIVGFATSGKQIVINSVFCALGFASAENFLYTIGLRQVHGTTDLFSLLSLFRFFMPFMMHVAAGPLLVSGHCIRGWRPLAGLALALVFHGAYDAVLMLSWPASLRIAYLLIIAGLIASAFVYRHATTVARD